MKTKLILGAALLAIVAMVGMASIQPPAKASEKTTQPPADSAKDVKVDFEKDDGGWKLFPGVDGTIERTQSKFDVHSGSYALQYRYTAAEGKFNAVIHTEPEYFAQGFRFWVKTDRPTALLFMLSEEGDEKWGTVIWTKSNQWQQVTVALSDLTENEDSQTKNGKVDMDKAEGIGFVDALALLAPAAGDVGTALFGYQTGSHILWIDDFEYLEHAPKRSESPDVLDAFKRDYLSWIGSAAVKLSQVSGGMEVRYQQEDPGFFLALRGVPKNFFAGSSGVRVKLSVKNPTTMLFSVEETDGERWQFIKEMGGENAAQTVQMNWNQFNPDEETKGKADGKLTPASIKMIGIVDLGVFTESGEPANTWVISEVAKMK